MNLYELEAKAKAATPEESEWNTEAPASERWLAMKAENAAFIRAWNPPTCLALIARIKELEAALAMIGENDAAYGKPFAIARAALETKVPG